MWTFIPTAAVLAAPSLAHTDLPCRILKTGAHAADWVSPSPRPPGTAKGERDAYGEFTHTVSSDNFVAKWGNAVDIDEFAVATMLEAFELSWSTYVQAWGMDPPYGSEDYKFNVYVGNTGSPAPSISGAYGYYTLDRDGWPMIVMLPELLDTEDEAASVAAHEFQHAMQDASGAFTGWVDHWYWEAGATWAAGEVYPESTNAVAYLYAYLYLPYLPLDTYAYMSSDLDALHHYGAFIFLRYLQEYTDDPSIIADSWNEGRPGDDPLEWLDERLGHQGRDLEWQFGHFAAVNATLDYERHEVYQASMNGGGWYDQSVVATSSGLGEPGWLDAPEDTLPGSYAYNLLELKSPYQGTLEVEIQVDAEGSEGTDASWTAWLVTTADDGVTYTEIPVADGAGSLQVESSGAEDAFFLSVAVTSPRSLSDEVFGWSYRFEITREDYQVDDWRDDYAQDGARGRCATGPEARGWPALLVAGLAARRRRRKT